MSTDVCTVTETLPIFALPMVSPPTVMRMADAEIVAPDVVMIKELLLVGPHVPARPITLLLPDCMVGVIDTRKKFAG